MFTFVHQLRTTRPLAWTTRPWGHKKGVFLGPAPAFLRWPIFSDEQTDWWFLLRSVTVEWHVTRRIKRTTNHGVLRNRICRVWFACDDWSVINRSRRVDVPRDRCLTRDVRYRTLATQHDWWSDHCPSSECPPGDVTLGTMPLFLEFFDSVYHRTRGTGNDRHFSTNIMPAFRQTVTTNRRLWSIQPSYLKTSVRVKVFNLLDTHSVLQLQALFVELWLRSVIHLIKEWRIVLCYFILIKIVHCMKKAICNVVLVDNNMWRLQCWRLRRDLCVPEHSAYMPRSPTHRDT